MPDNLRMTTSAWLWLLVLSVLWGGGFFFNRILAAELPPLTGALCRVAFAAIFLLMLAGVMRISLSAPIRLWRSILLLGILQNVVPFTLILWGQIYIASGLASIINATTPLFTILVAHMLTEDDKLTRLRVAGLMAGFTGVVLMIGQDLRQAFDMNVYAQIACLLAAFSYGFSSVFARRFKREAPLPIATGQLIASTLLLLPLVLLFDQPWNLPFPSIITIWGILGIAILSTALAFIIYFHVLAQAGATNTMLVTFMAPVSAVLLGALVFGERLAAHHFIGMLAIMFGLALIDGRPARWLGALIYKPR